MNNNITICLEYLKSHNKRLFEIGLIASCLITLLILTNPSYKAEAKILVVPKASLSTPESKTDYINTQIEQLKSKESLINTIYYVKLKKSNGKPMTAEGLKKILTVRRIKKTNVLQISLKYDTYKGAQEALTHLIKANMSMELFTNKETQAIDVDPAEELKKTIKGLLVEKVNLIKNEPQNTKAIDALRKKITDLTEERKALLAKTASTQETPEPIEAPMKLIEAVHGSKMPIYPLTFLFFFVGLGGYCAYKLKGFYSFQHHDFLTVSTQVVKSPTYLSTAEISALTPFPLLGIVPEVIVPTIFTTKGISSLLKVLEYFEKHPQFIELMSKRMVNIMITNYGDPELKTLISTALATSSALSGKKVALVSLTEDGGIKHYLGLNTSKGLTDFLWGDALNEIQTPTDIQDMAFIDRGSVNLPLQQILTHNRMYLLHSQLKVYFDVVIFDVDPLFQITNLGDFSPYIDATLVLMSSKELDADKMNHAYSLLKESFLPITGVIIHTNETLS